MVRTTARLLALILAGIIVASVGVGAHRALGYLGIVLALTLVLIAGIFARAWGRWAGFAAYAGAWAVMTIIYAQVGPARSVLIANDAHGYLWLYGGTAIIIVVALIPRRWLEGRDVAA
jgi:hypothetical protein